MKGFAIGLSILLVLLAAGVIGLRMVAEAAREMHEWEENAG